MGCELGRKQYLGIDYNTFVKVGHELPDATFVDAAMVLLKVRAVKPPAEIVAQAEADAFAAVRAGITTRDVVQMLRARMAELGGENVTFLLVSSGPETWNGSAHLIPCERTIEPGDAIVLNTGVEFQGYCADIARSATVGQPSDEIAEF